ncbi:MAG: PLP-dependent aminotransferase family protein [Bacteroidales bacterium]|nr:PLP-dependent aminotransferase family protein [Bacteroidales bacterium]HPE86205.1 PLP-dependent aminotransferase family protein [Bacteroidales bacterium]
MISNIQNLFSDQANRMKRSAIRECLKLTQQPDIISFAGGLPSKTSFPYDDIKKLAVSVIEEDGPAALQYSTTEGDNGLREQLLKRYQKEGLTHITTDNIVITTASQQSLDLLGKIFINPGDKIICGLPSYLGGISAFAVYGPELVGIKFDEHGMRADILEEKLKVLSEAGEKPKFIYVIPDFQNPAGITMPEFRRKKIIDLAHKYEVLIVEDSPYREVRFEGQAPAMMHALDKTGQVITLGTFSKIFCPGFRIGWIVADQAILEKFVQAKQTADLCTSSYLQKIAAKYLETGLFEKNLTGIIEEYKQKKNHMIKNFETYMPKGVRWTNPEGGLFLFLYLPEHLDAGKIFFKAIEKKVAFVQGDVFHCDGSGKNTLRINFSFVDKETNTEGVKRLAETIKESL